MSGIYPPPDVVHAGSSQSTVKSGAYIREVDDDSPAKRAGLEPGCTILRADRCTLRDVLDWRWIASDETVELEYLSKSGDKRHCRLMRTFGEDWGIQFDGALFDGVRECRNACTFCFMRQLPPDVRPSLVLRDDDYRLSFLEGTFVTLTNISAEDEKRICEQRISPLRVSLQASNAQVRKQIIGAHAQHGMEVLERLLDNGIQFLAQIVLVPGQNDGKHLLETLNWAWEHPGILEVGIVPLGFTRHQTSFFESYESPEAAREVIDHVSLYQVRALQQRGTPWVQLADEFYCNAYGKDVLQNLPQEYWYGSFDMFEDGIGIARSCIDEWRSAITEGIVDTLRALLIKKGMHVYYIAGYSLSAYFDQLVEEAGLEAWFVPVYVSNVFFGGNVTVTGLLCGSDIVSSLAGQSFFDRALICLPDVVLNDENRFLDDMTLEEATHKIGKALHVVSCYPKEYLQQLIEIVR